MDLVIGAVLVHGARAPRVVTRAQLSLMKTPCRAGRRVDRSGRLLRDLAPDHPFASHLRSRRDHPLLRDQHARSGADHLHLRAHQRDHALPGPPGRPAGVPAAIEESPGLKLGVNVAGGQVVYAPVARGGRPTPGGGLDEALGRGGGLGAWAKRADRDRRRAFRGRRAAALITLAGAGGYAIGALRSSGPRFAAATPPLANGCFASPQRRDREYLRTAGDRLRRWRAVASRRHPVLSQADRSRHLSPVRSPGPAPGRVPRRRPVLSQRAAPIPGTSTEWTIRHRHGNEFTISSTLDRRALTGRALARAGCRWRAPARAGGARRPGSGSRPTLAAATTPRRRWAHSAGRSSQEWGAAGSCSASSISHVHITANMRAGGELIYGESFDRYGISRALSAAGDARVHGRDRRTTTAGPSSLAGPPTTRSSISRSTTSGSSAPGWRGCG